MRRLNRFRNPESQLNVTPMLDVVFILLIAMMFLMWTVMMVGMMVPTAMPMTLV